MSKPKPPAAEKGRTRHTYKGFLARPRKLSEAGRKLSEAFAKPEPFGPGLPPLHEQFAMSEEELAQAEREAFGHLAHVAAELGFDPRKKDMSLPTLRLMARHVPALRMAAALGAPGRPADPWRTAAVAKLVQLDPVARRQEAERLVREHFGTETSVVRRQTNRLLASARIRRRKLSTAK
jgi:hypothetical protein